MWPKTFRESFCDRTGCPSEAFESRVFWRCLYRRSLLLSVIIYACNRSYFAPDFQTIRQLGVARSLDEFRAELEAFRYEYRMRGGLFRSLRVRVSGKRLMGLLREVTQLEGATAAKDTLIKTV